MVKVKNAYCSGLLDMSMGLAAYPPPDPEVTAGSSPPCESDLNEESKGIIIMKMRKRVINRE